MHSKLQLLVKILLFIAAIVIPVLSLGWLDCSWCAWWGRQFDWVVSFTLGGGLLMFFTNRIRASLFLFGLCAGLCLYANHWDSTPHSGEQSVSGPANSLRIASLELLAEPLDEEIIRIILDTEADLFSLQFQRAPAGFSDLHDAFLAAGYVSFRPVPSRDVFHHRIYARPGAAVQAPTAYWDSLSITAGKLVVAAGKRLFSDDVFFLSSHSQTPSTGFLQMAQRLSAIDRPLILTGHFSAALPCSAIRAFERHSRLKGSRHLQRISGSTAVSLPPINRTCIFYSEHFKCISFTTIYKDEDAPFGIVGQYRLVKETANAQQTSQQL